MGTAEVPNAALVIVFVVVTLAAGALVFTFATANPTDVITVPAASIVSGVAVFGTSMVVTLLADLLLWLAVLISLAVAAGAGALSALLWHRHNDIALELYRSRKASEDGDQGAHPGQTSPVTET